MPHNTGPFLTPELRAFFVPEHQELPGVEHPAVDHNLGRLYSPDFTQELTSESFGGNAGFEFVGDGTTFTCAGVNGYAEPESGRIIVFGNEQYLDPKVVNANSHINFKVGMSRHTFQIMIIGFFAAKSLSGEGKAVLGGTIEAFNFESDMVASEERQRLRELYGEVGLQALQGADRHMSPMRRYRSNPLLRFLRR